MQKRRSLCVIEAWSVVNDLNLEIKIWYLKSEVYIESKINSQLGIFYQNCSKIQMAKLTFFGVGRSLVCIRYKITLFRQCGQAYLPPTVYGIIVT